jgi:dethiobiotin synthetase
VTSVFITGTDTGVGKTFVACSLARAAVARGQRVFAFKPIETGCTQHESDRLIGDDQLALCAAAGNWQQGSLRGIYSFERAAAPLVASPQPIDLAHIADIYALGLASADHAIVEGAGGWRVPITNSADMSTLARALSLPIIIVGRAGLGTINHSVLTAEAVQRDGLSILAILLSVLPTDDLDLAQSNVDEIRRLTQARAELFRSSFEL